MNKIAALVDLDGRVEEIVEAAFSLAKKHEAELILYHFLPKDEVFTLSQSQIYINEDPSLNQIVSNCAERYEVNYKLALGTGKFTKSVNKLVQDEEIDLLIIGSNGRSSTIERIFGSHAEKVIESIQTTVLVIKDKIFDPTLQNVVFASSFNEMDKKILRHFLDLFKLDASTTIHLLMVDTYSFFNQPTLVVRESFEAFKEIAKPCQTQSHFYHGISVEEGILSFLKEVNPDLLVMSNKYSRLIRSAISSGSKLIATLHENDFPFLNVDYGNKK